MSTLLSVSGQGYVIIKEGVRVAERYYRNLEGSIRDRILRNLELGIVKVRGLLGHEKLIIELDNSYVHRHISDDQVVPRSDADKLYRIGELIEECDASVKYKLVRRTRADMTAKYAKFEDEDESVVSMFAGLEED